MSRPPVAVAGISFRFVEERARASNREKRKNGEHCPRMLWRGFETPPTRENAAFLVPFPSSFSSSQTPFFDLTSYVSYTPHQLSLNIPTRIRNKPVFFLLISTNLSKTISANSLDHCVNVHARKI